jgi:hypothetical protein
MGNQGWAPKQYRDRYPFTTSANLYEQFWDRLNSVTEVALWETQETRQVAPGVPGESVAQAVVVVDL